MSRRSSIAGAARGPKTMREVARLAGVSTATISRVLHNSPLVDAGTAERVRAIIREVNYVPNSTGPALKSGRSGIFGLIVPDFSNPFFADFVKHFSHQLVERDQEMLLAITDHSPAQMQRCVRRMLSRGVEGIVILDSEVGTRSYETVLHNLIPLVTLNRLLTEPGVSDVGIDAVGGMREAVAHLRGFDHTHIGFLGGTPGQRIAAARAEAFREGMAHQGLEVDETAMIEANFSFEGGNRAMQRLLQSADPPTAVLCVNDLSAFGAMLALADRGLVAGRDISIIGLDDIQMCTMVHPQLTTLRLSRERLVHLYLRALDHLVGAPHQPGLQYIQELDLVIRETTGPRSRGSRPRSRR